MSRPAASVMTPATSELPRLDPDGAATKPSARVSVAFLMSGLTVAWLSLLTPDRGVLQSVVAVALPVAALVAILLGIHVHRPQRRTAWSLLAFGQATLLLSDLIWYPVRNLTHIVVPYPSIADGFDIAGYLFFVTGLVLLVRSDPVRDRATFIDAGVITAGAFVLIWVFLMSPESHLAGLSLPSRIVSLGYPLMDLLLIFCLLRFAFAARAVATPTIYLLVAFFATLFVSDVSFLSVYLLHGTFETGRLYDACSMSGFALLGAAALHPSVSRVGATYKRVRSGLTRSQLMLFGFATLVAPSTLVIEHLTGHEHEDLVIAASAMIVTLLVLARMQGLISNLRAVEAARQRLLGHAIRHVESERSRIAHQLHDAPIQRLAALSLRLAAMSRRIRKGSQEQANGLLEELQTAIGTEINGLRRLMVDLRPPSLDQAGLRMAVEDQSEEFRRVSGATCSVDIDLENPLSTELETTMFRVIQEALRNAAQHSSCSEASVAVCVNDRRIDMAVHDDGVGFRPDHLDAHPGFGLASMRGHVLISNGEFEVVSAPGHGTTIKAVFPLERSRP